jgi:DNA-binding transcriptional LysR family regulator
MRQIHYHHMEMLSMNWRAFDLNLLVVFESLMQERSVTRAGKRLGMSQPAVSHALNRLRYLVKDQLFIRTPKGMVPTLRAEQLALPLRRALAEMERALEPEMFVAAEADRRFAVAVNNYSSIVVAPPLVAAASGAAPFVQLDLRPNGPREIFDRLDSGEFEVAIGRFPAVGERFGRTALLEDGFVAVMRRGHRAGRGKLSAEAFRDLDHVEISSSGDDTGFIDIDRSLVASGARRRIAARVPYLSAGAVLAGSDMVATLSRRVAERLVRDSRSALQLRELPLTSPMVRISMVWHRKLDGSSAHRWLRDLITSVCKKL